MRRLLISVSLFVLAANPQAGAQPPDAKSPADSLKRIKVRPGFTVELMAAEPLVMSPIAFAWGPDGKFWVVEMGDYPLGVDGKGKAGGKIKCLTKSKEDGPYDKATVFLDSLPFPTGVTPYGKGVLVTCAPDIFYAEDTDGDGKADKKEVLFTGFREGNQQHRVNGLVWGLDNWFYGANGDSGGKVKSLKTGKVVDISGRDFRLKPDTGEFEAVTGQTQFGRCRDDWGNWFGNNNSNPLYHYVLDDQYLRRNPFLLPPDPRVNVSVNPGASRVYPTSKPLPRFNSPQALNHFTSACSAIIYRDDLFGPEFVGNSFVSEPVHNLIHREIVKAKGVTFTSRRADDEQESEFLASSDNWFRPTTIATGPDGALWIADMYRYVIEHPEWIPKDWQAKLDLRAGQDKGRIYRVFPKDKRPRAIPRLDRMEIKELVSAFASPNGWQRDTAQQLLQRYKYSVDERSQDEARSAQEALADTMKYANNPLARLHALCTLHEISYVLSYQLTDALNDSHPAVRKHAVRAAESLPPGLAGLTVSSRLLNDRDPQVRLQLAYSLGALGISRTISDRLATLLCQESGDRYILAAALSSLTKENSKEVFASLMREKNLPVTLVARLLPMATAYGDATTLKNLLARHGIGDESELAPAQFTRLVELFNALGEDPRVFAKILDLQAKGGIKDFAAHLAKVHAEARRVALDPKSPRTDRQVAVGLLAHGLGNDREDYKLIAALLSPQTPDELQVAAIQSLGRSTDAYVARVVIGPWKGYSPALRAQALDALLTRVVWTRLLADALRNKEIPVSEIDTPRRQRLLDHSDAEVRQIAAKVFAASSSPDRGKLVDEYILTLPEKADPQRGAKLFAKTCAVCHKLGDVGQQVGPDLASVGDKSIQGLLVAILDPNRTVEARYVNYLAVTKDGRTLSGMIATETGTSVTLVGVDGKSHSLLRNEIDELTSTGKSMMPEGLEKDLPPQEMADLLAFVRAGLAPKSFPGNNPGIVRPDADGSVKLPAAKAWIYGPTLMLEKQYGNLGAWSSSSDHAVWKVELARPAKYAVWLDYACDSGSAGNTFLLEIGGQQLTGKVGGTASWDLYRRAQVGTLSLGAGKHEVTMRPQGTIRGALIDLKEIHLVPEQKGK
jgi:putative membrane-bound dehydrogenase-like protein